MLNKRHSLTKTTRQRHSYVYWEHGTTGRTQPRVATTTCNTAALLSLQTISTRQYE